MPMAPEPLITVITPAYNVASFIEETIDSVGAQTEPRFEYLIIDDASTDGTADVVERRIAGDDRMRLIRSAHLGGAAARNQGLAEARGAYISFIDGDDRWSPRKLETELAALSSLGPEYGAVFSRSWLISEGGIKVGVQRARKGRHDFDDLLVDNCPMGNGSSLLLKRSCFAEAGTFNTGLHSAADLDMWLRIAGDSSTPAFWCTGKLLVEYRLRSNQVSRSLDKRMAAVDELIGRYGVDLARQPLSRVYVRHAVTAYKAGDEERITRWGGAAWRSGLRYLVSNPAGRRLIGWRLLGRRGAVAYRAWTRLFLAGARAVLRLLAERVLPVLRRQS
jgi:glycosyltransferase involved in cell wall biosynthesis